MISAASKHTHVRAYACMYVCIWIYNSLEGKETDVHFMISAASKHTYVRTYVCMYVRMCMMQKNLEGKETIVNLISSSASRHTYVRMNVCTYVYDSIRTLRARKLLSISYFQQLPSIRTYAYMYVCVWWNKNLEGEEAFVNFSSLQSARAVTILARICCSLAAGKIWTRKDAFIYWYTGVYK